MRFKASSKEERDQCLFPKRLLGFWRARLDSFTIIIIFFNVCNYYFRAYKGLDSESRQFWKTCQVLLCGDL